MVSLIESWKAEKLSAWLYLRVAEAEEDDAISGLFVRLATAAEEQQRAAEEQLVQLHPDAGGRVSLLPARCHGGAPSWPFAVIAA